MGSRSDSPCRTYTSQTCYDPYIATSGDVTTATTSATTTTATTTSTKKTVLVAFYFFICSIRLRLAFARNSEADISKRELSFRNGHRITVFAPCTLPVCMHLCSHIACFMYACIGLALFLSACICVRTLHVSCMYASVFERCIQYGSELTIHTLKSFKGSMGAIFDTTWERTNQTTIEDDMDTVLFVCFIRLFVCLVLV